MKQLRATLFNVANDYDTKNVVRPAANTTTVGVGAGASADAPGTGVGGGYGAPASKTRELTRLTRGFGQANNDW